MPKGKNKKPVNKDRFISKMFLRYLLIKLANLDCYLLTFGYNRGDSVILSESCEARIFRNTY